MSPRKKKSAEVWLGLLVIVSSVLVTWGYFWLTGQPLENRGYQVVAIMPNADGLERGDRVRVAGVEVGSVRSVQLATPRQVLVQLQLHRNVRLPRDSRAVLEAASLFGDLVIELYPGTSTALLSDGDTLIAGQETALMDVAGQIGEEAEIVLRQVERLLADTAIDDIHGSLAALKGTVRGLERLVRENGDEFTALSRSLTKTAQALEEAIAGADVDQAVSDLEATAATLSETAEALQQTAESLASVFDKIDRGEGTLGLMINDPGLYEELRSAARSLGSLTQDIRENPGRYLSLSIF